MDSQVDNDSLQRYLDVFQSYCFPMPRSERARVRAEVRAHLVAMIAQHEAEGMSTAKSTLKAINDFGDPRKIGNATSKKWRQGHPRSFISDYNDAQNRQKKWTVMSLHDQKQEMYKLVLPLVVTEIHLYDSGGPISWFLSVAIVLLVSVLLQMFVKLYQPIELGTDALKLARLPLSWSLAGWLSFFFVSVLEIYFPFKGISFLSIVPLMFIALWAQAVTEKLRRLLQAKTH